MALGKGWHSAKTLLPSATLSKAGKQNFFSFFQLISLQRGRNSISVNIYSSHISHKPSHSHHISSVNTKYPSQSIKVSINAHSPSQIPHTHDEKCWIPTARPGSQSAKSSLPTRSAEEGYPAAEEGHPATRAAEEGHLTTLANRSAE